MHGYYCLPSTINFYRLMSILTRQLLLVEWIRITEDFLDELESLRLTWWGIILTLSKLNWKSLGRLPHVNHSLPPSLTLSLSPHLPPSLSLVSFFSVSCSLSVVLWLMECCWKSMIVVLLVVERLLWTIHWLKLPWIHLDTLWENILDMHLGKNYIILM